MKENAHSSRMLPNVAKWLREILAISYNDRYVTALKEVALMRLVSFDVKHCFGFRNRGVVNLDDRTNLIYLLGKNSSGKTSFLTAMASMSSTLPPVQQPNFANFDPTSDVSLLVAKYQSEPGDMSIDKFMSEFRRKQDEQSRNDQAIFY
ncbi:MAG: hypothetical protein ABI068_15075 [Ktedonobacterales bacterium]